MDNIDPQTRSLVMAAVRSRGNKSTENAMLSVLKSNHVTGWRRHYKITGTPDFAWPKEKVALFVDGCFWHGCPFCRRPPKSNVEFWASKVEYNQRHDKAVSRRLRNSGWSVIRVRECKVNDPTIIDRIVRTLAMRIKLCS